MEPQHNLDATTLFSIEFFKYKVGGMSEPDCKSNLIEMYTQIIYLDMFYKAKIAAQLGITMPDTL